MKTLCRFIYKLVGWKVVGTLPEEKKYIIIVAPHTSNWDFFVCLCARYIMNLKGNFLAKSQLFFFPVGNFLRAIGGAPVDRSKHSNLVESAVAMFKEREQFILALAPEGTRSPVARWKEGFYYIACQAGVPIVMIGPDFVKKEVIVAPAFWPSGDINKDFPQILDYFRGISGRYPKEIPEYIPKESG